MDNILMPYRKHELMLNNHLAMAPMIRSRAIDNIPNELMVAPYVQYGPYAGAADYYRGHITNTGCIGQLS